MQIETYLDPLRVVDRRFGVSYERSAGKGGARTIHDIDVVIFRRRLILSITMTCAAVEKKHGSGEDVNEAVGRHPSGR